MPTGYTVLIENGKISTGKEFLHACLREFGIAAYMREEPLEKPVLSKFEIADYFKNDILEAKKRLDAAMEMTIGELKEKRQREYENRQKNAKKFLAEYTEKQKKLDAVKAEVEKWDPPTPEHAGIKKFAIEQLERGSYDYQINYYKRVLTENLDISDFTVAQELSNNVKSAARSLEITIERYNSELEHVAKANEFMKVFIESLDQLN